MIEKQTFTGDLENEIHLSEDNLLGTGTRRLCYEYPGKLDLCIKIPMTTKNGIKQQKREVVFYQKLAKRGVPTERVTRYHGTVETSLGTGYVYDAIRDADGSTSKQFMHYLRNVPERHAEYLAILLLLEAYLFENRVVFYDLSPWNILCRQNGDGSLEPFIIDGVGDIVAIPVLNLSDKLLHGKIKRRWFRMINKLTPQFDWMKDYHFSHDFVNQAR